MDENAKKNLFGSSCSLYNEICKGAIFELSGIKMQPLGISYVGASLAAAGHNEQIELLES